MQKENNMWKEFYKDGKAYTFDIYKSFKNDREAELISDGYIPIFDRRLLFFSNSSNCGSAILENDAVVPDSLVELQNEIKSQCGLDRIKHMQYTSLHPLHLKELKKLIEAREIKNILIDSLFRDIEQFRYAIKNVFSYFLDINFFINSHGTLLKLLHDEIDNYMDKYEVRNSYYTLSGNGKPWFNDLTFTLIKNNIYEIDEWSHEMNRVKFKAGYDKCEVYLDGRYKWMQGKYTTDDTDLNISEAKSIWK